MSVAPLLSVGSKSGKVSPGFGVVNFGVGGNVETFGGSVGTTGLSIGGSSVGPMVGVTSLSVV